jgi:amidophosphoribosyltransferase
MARIIGVDSLAFLSIDGLYRAVGESGRGPAPRFCDACFTGDYPTRLADAEARESAERQPSLLEEV